MAAKQTANLIPLCHPLPITHINIDFNIYKEKSHIDCLCCVETDGKTGVEMEALTAVSVTALTLYDMAKALEKSMQIEAVHLEVMWM